VCARNYMVVLEDNGMLAQMNSFMQSDNNADCVSDVKSKLYSYGNDSDE